MEVERLLKKKKNASEDGNLEALATYCRKLAELYVRDEKFEDALKIYEEELSVYTILERHIDVAVTHRMIGEVYSSMGNYKKALEHQNKHLEMARELNNQTEEQRALATIGRTFFCMSESFIDKEDPQYKTALSEAKKAYLKSLNVCERLKGISRVEVMLMRSRLLLNLGLVLESQGDVLKACDYIQKAITVNKQNDLFEDLYRCYNSLAMLYVRQSNPSKALMLLNLALEVASRLPDKALLSCESLVSKAEIHFNQGDFEGAKQDLIKAYKLKSPNKEEQDNIERQLKTAVALCKTETKLCTVPDNDFATKKKLYEIMGDGSVAVKNFDRAVIYYHKMLECAEAMGDTGPNLAAIYVSLSQTYKDQCQLSKALEYCEKELQIWENNPAEACRTTLSIAQIMEQQGANYSELERIYNKACKLATAANNKKLEASALRSLYETQKFKGREHLAEQTKALLEAKGIYKDDESSSNSEDDMETPDIGDDICLEMLSDLSASDSDEFNRLRPNRKRRCGLKVRRNEKGETQLHTACISGNTALVKRLLEQGHPLNVRDHCGWLPLHEACNLGFPEIVLLLLDKGASIDDRGGSLCGGVTPLHDAASCGNLEVMKILLERGASVIALTNEGKTPLDCLLEWYSRTEELDHTQKTMFESVSDYLRKALDKAGYKAQEHPTIKNIVVKPSSSNQVQNVKCKNITKKTKVPTSNRRSLDYDSLGNNDNRWRLVSPDNSDDGSSDIVSSSVDVKSSNQKRQYIPKLSSDNSEDDDFGVAEITSSCFNGTDDESGQMAKEEYQRVISGLRSRSSFQTPGRFHKPKRRGGLLSSEEVGDDWLEDDLADQRQNKRKKTSENSSFIGSSLRTKTNDKKPKQIIPETSLSSLSQNFTEASEVDDVLDDYGIGDIISQTLPKRKVSELAVKAIHSGESTSFQSMINNEQTSTVVPLMTVPSQSQLSRAVRVHVEDRKLLVPIPTENASLTIGWLANETARRYYNLEGLRPSLNLLTNDGALLAEDDPLSLLGTSEEIVASIISWNLPPLIDRYIEAASNMHKAVDKHLHNLLEICQATQNLQLQDLSLNDSTISPIFRALRYQNTLQSICLTGNLLGDEGLKLLCASLPTMPQLKELDISSNNISALGLTHFNSLFSPSSSPTLQALKALDLSFNPLGNGAIGSLQTIFSSLISLQKLKLSSCDFTSHVFKSNGPSNRHCLNCVVELDVSFNVLDREGIAWFLNQLNMNIIEKLNLAHTQSNCADGRSFVTRELTLFLNHEQPEDLKELDLSGCYVHDADIWELISSIQKVGLIGCLNLRNNPALSSISLRRLLQIKVEILDLSGCYNILQHIGDTSITDWLSQEKSLRKLFLSSSMGISLDTPCEEKHGPGGQLVISFQ